MPKARIYQPDKTAMQSGKAKTKRWLLEFIPDDPLYIEPLMGWVGMKDTKRELQLRFPTKEAAIAYAQANHIEFELFEAHVRKQIIKPYAENFRFNKKTGYPH